MIIPMQSTGVLRNVITRTILVNGIKAARCYCPNNDPICTLVPCNGDVEVDCILGKPEKIPCEPPPKKCGPCHPVVTFKRQCQYGDGPIFSEDCSLIPTFPIRSLASL